MENASLGQAVAQVLRAELAARRINGPTFAAMVGESKANAWRKVEGQVKISFDDLDRYAAALGLSVDDVVARAVAIQREGRVYEPPEGHGEATAAVVEESRKLRRRPTGRVRVDVDRILAESPKLAEVREQGRRAAKRRASSAE